MANLQDEIADEHPLQEDEAAAIGMEIGDPHCCSRCSASNHLPVTAHDPTHEHWLSSAFTSNSCCLTLLTSSTNATILQDHYAFV